MAKSGSISFDRLAAVYDATRGGLQRGGIVAGDLSNWVVPGKAVEIGIGTGAVALPLRQATDQTIVGVDISMKMAAMARDRLGAVIAVGDANRLPLADAAVDTLIAVWVFQLIDDPQAALRECLGVLRPGGRLLVVVGRPETDPDDIEPHLDRCLDGLRRPGGDHELVISFARRAGFVLVDSHYGTELRWEETPNHAADRIENKTYGLLLDLDDDEYQRRAGPAIEALRALPDPDRPRSRVARHPLLVFERP